MKRSISTLFALVLYASLSGQEAKPKEPKGSLDSGNIASQYDYLINESNSFQEYKVIRKTWVAKFEKNLKDSIREQGERENSLSTQISSQQSEISELKQSLTSTRDSLGSVEKEKNNMSWLGMDVGKGSYKMIMWSLTAIMTLVMLVFLVMFRNSNRVTVATKERFRNLDEEFTAYKKRSLEREQKLRRELQDEINKQK